MLVRAILPQWAHDEDPSKRRVLEGEFTPARIQELNEQLYYNIYYLPNGPSLYDSSKTVDGGDIDCFKYCFVDFDLKDGTYNSKDDFLDFVLSPDQLAPTSVVDSGNGIHVYWAVSDLDAMSYLRLQRRLLRKYRTDEAVGQIYQLMRVPGTLNTKSENEFKLCIELAKTDYTYTAEDLDRHLPEITQEDEKYCHQHHNKTYRINQADLNIDEKLPAKFEKLLNSNEEVKEIWLGQTDDRSKGDYRLGHVMFASGFTRDEAISVLVNTGKALARAPIHRSNYALNIVDKIWTYELAEDKDKLDLSMTVREILSRNKDSARGHRFPCYRWLDHTHHGFRLGQVIGLVAGSGVGKTAMALNMFQGFVEFNPDYDHFIVALEQPAHEIAERWKTMCGDKTYLHDKVHVISNQADDGTFRHLSFDDLRAYAHKFIEKTGRKIGCFVIDHIGALRKKGKDGENQDIMDICHEMKGFALELDVLLVMQSQSSREKAGIGDLELNKDAAYGTMYFEAYCDYLVTMWQPLKRCYSDPTCPTVTAYKFCKIRHKKKGRDVIQEDVSYTLVFDPETERMRQITDTEEKSFTFFLQKATNMRNQDRKTDLVPYQSRKWEDQPGVTDGKASSNSDSVAV